MSCSRQGLDRIVEGLFKINLNCSLSRNISCILNIQLTRKGSLGCHNLPEQRCRGDDKRKGTRFVVSYWNRCILRKR